MLARPLRDGSSDGCLADVPCEKLNAECLVCQFNSSCVYGEEVTVTCEPRTGVKCTNKSPSFERRMVCQYCYQTPSSEHVCEHNSSCQVNSAPRQRYIAQCTVRPNVLCLGEFRQEAGSLDAGSKGAAGLLLAKNRAPYILTDASMVGRHYVSGFGQPSICQNFLTRILAKK